VAPLPAAEPRRLADGGAGPALRGETNRALATTASATALPVSSQGGGGAVAFDYQQSLVVRSRRRSRLRWLSFMIVVAVPAVIAAAYYFFVAADQYVAEFRFALRSAEPERRDPNLFLQESLAPSPIGVDSYVVVQYLASRAIIDDLSTTIDLRQMFSRSEADWPARLDPPVSIEELVRYWKGQVDAPGRKAPQIGAYPAARIPRQRGNHRSAQDRRCNRRTGRTNSRRARPDRH